MYNIANGQISIFFHTVIILYIQCLSKEIFVYNALLKNVFIQPTIQRKWSILLSEKMLYNPACQRIFLHATPCQRNFLYATPFKRKFCIQCPLKENLVYNSLWKNFLDRMPFERKLYIFWIQCPIKENSVYKGLWKKNLYLAFFQKKIVYNALSKKMLYTTPFQRKFCIVFSSSSMGGRDRPILFNRFLPIPILTDSLILNLADTDTDFQQ